MSEMHGLKPGRMTRAEVLTLVATSLAIIAVANYTFYWLAFSPPKAEFTLLLDARAWAGHAAKLYEKYYPASPPEEEWFTIVIPADVWVDIILFREEREELYRSEPVGAHYFASPNLPGIVGLIPPGMKFRAGTFKLAPDEKAQFGCGEYCFPAHDYMSFARIIAKKPRVLEYNVWMHQWYISTSPEPILDWRAGGPQERFRGENYAIIEAELGDIVRIKVHLTNKLEPEFEAMGFASRRLGFEKEVTITETVTFEFRADKVGEFDIYCSISCGTGHELMTARLIVKPITIKG